MIGKLRQFKRSDPSKLDITGIQELGSIIRQGVTDGAVCAALENPSSWTFENEEGVPIACGGVVPIWSGRGYAWSIFSRHVTPHNFIYFARLFKQKLEYLHAQEGYHRIETTVDENFLKANRWVKILGFEREGWLRKFTPDGVNHYMYARVW